MQFPMRLVMEMEIHGQWRLDVNDPRGISVPLILPTVAPSTVRSFLPELIKIE